MIRAKLLLFTVIFMPEWDMATMNRIYKVLKDNQIPIEQLEHMSEEVFTATKGVGKKTWIKCHEGFKKLNLRCPIPT